MEDILKILQDRFEGNMHRHSGIQWSDILSRLEGNSKKLDSLRKMEETGGEPDVVGYDEDTGEYIFMDCSKESPIGRRSLCYDREGQDSRKDNSAKGNVVDMASEMGIELLNEEQYRELQELGEFDIKTSSWLRTPDDIRELGGAIFGDCRYGRTFVYHNGAQSYYGGRGFRGMLRV